MPPSRFIEVDKARQNNLKGVSVRVPIGARHRRHRRRRGRQVLARLRRAVRRGPPPLRRDLQPLRAPVPGAARPPARRADRGRAAGRRGRPHRARAHLALDRRHDDLGRRLPARALRARGRPALPPVRPAGRAATRRPRSSRRCSTPRAAARSSASRTASGRKVAGRVVREAFEKAGLRRVLEDGQPVRIEDARLQPEDGVVTVVLDRVTLARDERQRIVDSIEAALRQAQGRVELRVEGEAEPRRFSEGLHCARCDIAYADPSPALFSFNNPVGACATCKGFGRTMAIDPELVIPDPRRTLAGRRGQAVPDELLQRLPGRPRALPEARGLPARTCPGPSCPRRAAGGLGRRARRPQQLAAQVVRHRAASSPGSSRKTYKMHVRVLLSRYRSYRPVPRLRRHRGSRPRRACSGSPGARCPSSRRCPSPDAERALPRVVGARRRTPPRSSCCTRSAAACASWSTSASAT